MFVFVEIFRRVGGEFGAAAAGAEEILFPAVRVAMFRRRRIDRHAANRIDGLIFRGSAGLLVMMVV